MEYVTEYKKLSSDVLGEYFVGYNSFEGFVGKYIDQVDEKKLRRLYVIKGAAGTGKSTIMKTVTAEAQKAGYNVERYACGSDPDSLDLIIVNSKVALIDGTSPHSHDLAFPGASSEFIDLSKFWDSSKLVEKRGEIINLTEQKKQSYENTYRQLRAVRTLRLENSDYIKKVLDLPKLNKSLDRLVKGLGKSDGEGKAIPRILRSVGMKGFYRLDTFETSAQTLISVSDVYSSAYEYMRCFAEKLKFAKLSFEYSFDPICPEHICEIFVPSASVLVTVEQIDNADRHINMHRFVKSEELSSRRGWLRLSAKCCSSILDEVKVSLEAAGKAHFALEGIYSSSVDFKALSNYTEALAEKIIAMCR